MAATDPMMQRYAEDLILELERLHEDIATLEDLSDRLREADCNFRQVLFTDGVVLLDRNKFQTGNLPTDHIDRLFAQMDVQLQRAAVTVKRSRESFKLTGL